MRRRSIQVKPDDSIQLQQQKQVKNNNDTNSNSLHDDFDDIHINTNDDDNGVVKKINEPLLKIESSFHFLRTPPITTATFLQTTNDESDSGSSDFVSSFRQRVKTLCERQPWLTSILIKNKQKQKDQTDDNPTSNKEKEEESGHIAMEYNSRLNTHDFEDVFQYIHPIEPLNHSDHTNNHINCSSHDDDNLRQILCNVSPKNTTTNIEYINQIISEKCSSELLVPNGNDMLKANNDNKQKNHNKKKQKRVCQITLCRCIKEEEESESTGTEQTHTTYYLLIFSLSHCVADGNTYYHLLQQLFSSSPHFYDSIPSVIDIANGENSSNTMSSEKNNDNNNHDNNIVISCKRNHNAAKECQYACGKEETAFAMRPSVICNIIGKLIFGSKKQADLHVFCVDPEKLKDIKENKNRKRNLTDSCQVPFVSTNDILTSSFGNATNCRVLFMPVNLRNRIQSDNDNLNQKTIISDENGGNYESCILYDPITYDTPNKIRQSISSKNNNELPFKRIETDCIKGTKGRRSLPKRCEAMTCKLAMITNWSFPFFKCEYNNLKKSRESEGNDNDDIQQQESASCCDVHIPLHLPIANMKEIPFDMAVVFRMNKDKVAVYYCIRSSDTNVNDIMKLAPLSKVEESINN